MSQPENDSEEFYEEMNQAEDIWEGTIANGLLHILKVLERIEKLLEKKP